MKSRSPITMYIDGNHSIADGRWTGGWACKLVANINGNTHDKEFFGFEERGTNYAMKLTAIHEGIKALKQPCEIVVHTNDQTLINVANNMRDFIARKGLCKNKRPMACLALWDSIIESAKAGGHHLTFVKSDVHDVIRARTETKLIYKS